MHGKSEVIVISGFLGAGKTTLLKKILTWESDLSETVVIVNEDLGLSWDTSWPVSRITRIIEEYKKGNYNMKRLLGNEVHIENNMESWIIEYAEKMEQQKN